MRWIGQVRASQGGTSLIELLVAAAVFTLLVVAVDGVFITAHRSTQQAELGAEVAQNARIGVERLTREIREANRNNIVWAASAAAFRSARPNDTDPSPVFCLNVPDTTPPDRFFSGSCNYYGSFGGDYTPVWQRIIGYRLVATSGPNACGSYDLHRYVIAQTALTTPALPADPANPGAVTQEAVIASCIEDLRVSLQGSSGRSRFSIAVLLARGERQIQGSSVPPQQIRLTGEAWIRNDQP